MSRNGDPQDTPRGDPKRQHWGAVVTDWMDEAACKGATALFFPAPGRGGDTRGMYDKARAICAGCPVREECLQYAVEHGERFGMWGGMVRDERIAEKARRVA